jgi:hypothetical protein
MLWFPSRGKFWLVRCVNTCAMHVGVYKEYMKLYIVLSPNHTFAYNIVVFHH